MSKKQKQRANAKGVKAEADRRFRGIAEQASQYKGRCLFPADANGGFCSESPSRRHVIPRASVLNQLKDPKSGKVLDLDWGVDQWAALILKSDERHPVNLEDPATFELREVGIRGACTGPYACGVHDAVFIPIDTATPDFEDPGIRWLTMGRIALYAADLCSRRKFLVDAWKWQTLRGGNRALRSSWLRESQFAYTAHEKAHLAARVWGESWLSLKSPDDLPDALVDSSVQTFRSRLRMAACVYYGQATAVVVLPKEGDEHTMALLHWSEDKGRVVDDQKRLINKAQNTKANSDYGIDFFIELMSRGSGAVAASPESFRELPIVQRTEVQKVVMRGLQAAGITQASGRTRRAMNLLAKDDTGAVRYEISAINGQTTRRGVSTLDRRLTPLIGGDQIHRTEKHPSYRCHRSRMTTPPSKAIRGPATASAGTCCAASRSAPYSILPGNLAEKTAAALP